MTYTPDPDSDDPAEARAAALIDSLRLGVPLLRARLKAGYGSPRALADACAATPGLEEACTAAEADGAKVRAARVRKEEEASDGSAARVRTVGDRGTGGTNRDRGAAEAAAAPVARPAGGDAVLELRPRLAEPHADVRRTLKDEEPATVGETAASPANTSGVIPLRAQADGGGPPIGIASTTPPAPVKADPSGLRALAVDLARMRAEEGAANDAEAPVVPLDPLAQEVAAAARFAPGLLGFILLVDARCIAAGMPPMSPWWRYSIGSFIESEKSWGIWDVGRGAGKSTMFERITWALARYGERKIPPGQTWTIPLISVGPDDANRRINGMAAVARANGQQIIGEDVGDGKAKEGVRIARAPRGSLDLLDVRGNPIQIGSIAGTVGNVSGPSTVSLMIDEASKLHDRVTNASPLTEIIASAAQTSRGRAGWRGFVCSSAYDRQGVHFQLVERGDNETTFVARIGPAFLDAAVDGFELVAAWEQRRGDTEAAKIIREHAASLRADSPLVPTWVPNPTLGNPTGEAWEGAALATRMLVEVLPEAALDGIPRIRFWLRECGSVPMDRGGGGFDPWAQLDGLEEMNAMLAAASRGDTVARPTPGANVGPMKVRGAPPGDARYDGAADGGAWVVPSWERNTVF